MKIILGSIMLLGLASAATGSTIECYKGTSTTDGYNATSTETTEKACFVTTTVGEMGSTRGSIDDDAGCTEIVKKTCTGDDGWSKCETETKKTCVCKEELCNNAPATAAALMSIITMALVAKFMI